MNRRGFLKHLGLGAGAATVLVAPKLVEAIAPERVPVTTPAVVEMLDGVPVAVHVMVSNGQDRASVETYETVSHGEVAARKNLRPLQQSDNWFPA